MYLFECATEWTGAQDRAAKPKPLSPRDRWECGAVALGFDDDRAVAGPKNVVDISRTRPIRWLLDRDLPMAPGQDLTKQPVDDVEPRLRLIRLAEVAIANALGDFVECYRRVRPVQLVRGSPLSSCGTKAGYRVVISRARREGRARLVGLSSPGAPLVVLGVSLCAVAGAARGAHAARRGRSWE